MKRIALVDNATLTACQRLLGDSKVANLYNIDGDIAAMEGLLQAFLFCDEIVCLDDYKREFREQRQKRFDFIRFLPKDEVDYSAAMEAAKKTTEDISFRVRGREIDNEAFAEFFNQLKTHLVFNWQESSSVHYLTLNLLTDDSGVDVEKYSVMHAMLNSQLFGESGDDAAHTPIVVRDRSGNSLKHRLNGDNGLGISKQVELFGAALNWLALKSAFYIEVAESQNLELVLHPIRHAFVLQTLKNRHDLTPTAYDSVTALLRAGISNSVAEITKATDPILSKMLLPMWSAFLATRAQDPLDFFTECRHIREEGAFVEARNHLAELEYLNQDRGSTFVVKVNKLNAALQKTSKALLKRYGVEASQGLSVSPLLSLITKPHGGLSVPDVIRVPLPGSFHAATARYGFRGILRSVTDDLVTIERLGKLHDVITSRVQKTTDKKYPVKAETLQWVGLSSSWKKWI